MTPAWRFTLNDIDKTPASVEEVQDMLAKLPGSPGLRVEEPPNSPSRRRDDR
jgi:hypothetical protein